MNASNWFDFNFWSSSFIERIEKIQKNLNNRNKTEQKKNKRIFTHSFILFFCVCVIKWTTTIIRICFFFANPTISLLYSTYVLVIFREKKQIFLSLYSKRFLLYPEKKQKNTKKILNSKNSFINPVVVAGFLYVNEFFSDCHHYYHYRLYYYYYESNFFSFWSRKKPSLGHYIGSAKWWWLRENEKKNGKWN